MKYLFTLLLLGLFSATIIFVSGIDSIYNIIPASPMSAYSLSKTHPRLQKICNIEHGCFFVTIKCTKYDDSGNSDLRGLTFWEVSDWWDNINGAGIDKYDGKDSLNAAIKDWFRDKEIWEEINKEDENKTVYPNSKPCDPDCIEGQN